MIKIILTLRQISRGNVAVMKTLVTSFIILATSLSTQAQSLKDRDDSYAFLNNMQKHHEQALALAQIAANNAMGNDVRSFSRELVQSTQAELNEIKDARSRLPSQLTPAIDPSKTNAITIANPNLRAENLSSPQTTMPSLPINPIQNTIGTEFDKKYTETMSDYQKQGAEIAKKAATEIGNPIIKDLARKMSQNLEVQQKSFSQMAASISATTASQSGIQ